MRWLPKFLTLTLFLTLSLRLQAQLVDVKISPTDRLNAFHYQALGDKVVVTTADSFPRLVTTLNTLEQLKVTGEDAALKLQKGDELLGTFESLLFWCNDEKPRFKLHYAGGKRGLATYPGHLAVYPGGRNLKLVNHVYLEDYIRCVIHAEAGHHRSLDFFKVQALSARTYALKNRRRHASHGYQLCDNTHCQAYKGEYRRSELIEQAVDETRDEVIVFGRDQLIEAVFSANCGGFTANSEDVWIANVDYLRAVPDYNFCEGTLNHAWHATVPKLQFLAKLGRYFKLQATSFEVVPDVSGRVKRIYVNHDPKLVISGEEIRRLFRFKSSKFHVYDSGSLLFVEGAGFGHGVGMCQDGAWYMSELGLDYEKILRHYYQDIEIVTVDRLEGIWK